MVEFIVADILGFQRMSINNSNNNNDNEHFYEKKKKFIKQKHLERILNLMPKGINKPLTDGLKKETFPPGQIL